MENRNLTYLRILLLSLLGLQKSGTSPAQSNILQPTSIVAEGSVNVGHANGIYGDDAVRRVDPLLSGAQKAWINTDDELCAGTLQEFYCFIHNISLLIDRFRTIYLQIWMPIDIVNLEFELVFSKAANITIDSNVGLLLKFDVCEFGFVVTPGSMLGFTNEYDESPISFEYDEDVSMYYRGIEDIGIPEQGDRLTFLNVPLPAIFSIAVKIDPMVVSCPVPCGDDGSMQCQQCELWYVPERSCDVYLKLADLDAGFDPVLVEVTQTIAVIRFKQDSDDMPAGYENHYYYQLLYKNQSNTFEIWEDSEIVYHVVKTSDPPLVTLTATNLAPDTSYTFKCAIYRTHRGNSEKGTIDSKQITLTTDMMGTTYRPQIEDDDVKQGKSNKVPLVLAILFGILLLVLLVLIMIFIARRYFVHGEKTESPDSVTKGHQTLKPTTHDIKLQASGYSHDKPTGNNEESGYTSITSETRDVSRDSPYADLYQER